MLGQAKKCPLKRYGQRGHKRLLKNGDSNEIREFYAAGACILEEIAV